MSSHHIQIGDISPRIQCTGDGSQVAFTYPFPIFKDSDIEVFEDATLRTIVTDYTVSGAGNDNGGTVTFVTAPLTGVVVTLKRTITIARTSDFDESGAFRSKVINDELDTITAVQQQLKDSIDRSLRQTETDAAGTMTIPEKDTRKGKFLRFDATTGDPEAADVTGVTVLSDANPLALGAAAPGTSGDVSRTDHVHPTTGLLLAANNLSDVADAAAARSNLGIGSKNLIINGDMQVAQRGTITGVAGASYGGPDRFQMNGAGSMGIWTLSQETDVPSGEGLSHSFRAAVTTSGDMSGATSFALIRYMFEGLEV